MNRSSAFAELLALCSCEILPILMKGVNELKKSSLFLWSVIILLSLSGCNAGWLNSQLSSSTASESMASISNVKEYFPINNNVRYFYDGKGSEFASLQMTVDYTDETKVQQRWNNGGTEIVSVLAYENDKIVETFSMGEIYYRENFLNRSEKHEVILAGPIKKGNTWTLSDGKVRTITETAKVITTPYGQVESVEVTTEGSSGKTVSYYAKEIGLVKTVTIAGKDEVSSTLNRIVKNDTVYTPIRFYYPNINDDKIYYDERKIAFQTNDNPAEKFLEELRDTAPYECGFVFTKNTKINSLIFNLSESVKLDLSEAFLTEMNAGSGYEAMLLKCIANTFGYYFNASKVLLTIDGKEYSSGHIYFEKGETMSVDFSGTEPAFS